MGCIRHVVNNELEHLAMSTKAGSECHTIGNTERVLHKAVRVYLRHSLWLALELRPVAWICFPHLSIPIINAKVYVKAALAWKQCNVTAVHILTRLSYASHWSCLALPLFAFVIANVVPHDLCGKCGACNTWLVVCNHAALLICFSFFSILPRIKLYCPIWTDVLQLTFIFSAIPSLKKKSSCPGPWHKL